MTQEQALAQWEPSVRAYIERRMSAGESIAAATSAAIEKFAADRPPIRKGRTADHVSYMKRMISSYRVHQ